MPDLDPRQQAAVSAGPIDLFVTAGAGSGKTRVLSSRFVNAVLGAPPYERCDVAGLVAVTYTEKAAGELAERIRAGLAASGEAEASRSIGEAWISTIHGMCSRILRQHALAAGVDPQFRVLDDVGSSALEAEALEEVISSMLEVDDGFAALLDAYGWDAVVLAAQTIRAKVRALGLDVKDIRTVSAPEAWEMLREARDGIAQLAPEFRALRATKTVEANMAALQALLAALGGLRDGGGEEAADALAGLCACSLQRRSSIEGLNELVEACAARLEAARQAAAQLAVRPHERAFLTFAAALDRRYRQLKDDRGALDFEDLQVKTAELLESHPAIAAGYRRRFAMLMLDEFQDTNELQLRIMEQLADGNLCTVGDENQSIYAFRHADVEVFRQRGRQAASRAELDINYRTAPALLASLNGFFSHASLLGPGFLRLRAPEPSRERPPWPESQPRFEVRFIDTSEKDGSDVQEVEAHCIAERVEQLIAEGVSPGDIAVLMQAMSGGRALKVETELGRRNIRAYIASGGSFFDRSEVAEARALLRVISNVWDDAALTTVLAGRLTGLTTDALVALRAHADDLARAASLPVWDAHLWAAATSSALELPSAEASRLARTVAVIEQARAVRGTCDLAHIVLEPLLALDMDLVLLSGGRGGMRAWSNLLKLARLGREFESAGGGDLGAFLDYLDLREVHATSEQEATVDGEGAAVRVMSIHSAKGLEFPVVIVAGLSSPRDRGPIVFGRAEGQPMIGMTLPFEGDPLPTIASERLLAAAREAAAAESVRLLYVACTRAEESLTIIAKTDSTKEAGQSLPGLVRAALGFEAPETIAEGPLAFGEATAWVSVKDATLPAPAETADSQASSHTEVQAPACGLSELPELRRAQPPATRGPRRVSYTALSTFERCPRRFFLTSIAKLPAPPAARSGGALAFGSAVHDVLERCRTRDDDPQQWVAQAAAAAGLPKAEEARLLAAARAYLSSPVAAEVFSAESVMREAAIAVQVGDAVLGGAIDCIAWFGQKALIVDYKTGSAPLEESAALERYRLQAECYALAAFRAGATGVRVIFAELERGREAAYEFAADDAEEVASRVLGIVERIERDGFEPRDTYDTELCETCPGIGGLCPVRRPSAGAA